MSCYPSDLQWDFHLIPSMASSGTESESLRAFSFNIWRDLDDSMMKQTITNHQTWRSSSFRAWDLRVSSSNILMTHRSDWWSLLQGSWQCWRDCIKNWGWIAVKKIESKKKSSGHRFTEEILIVQMSVPDLPSLHDPTRQRSMWV